MSATYVAWAGIYRALIQLLPSDFRDRHAAELEDVFARVTRLNGRISHRRAARECKDVVLVALRLRVRRNPARPVDHSFASEYFAGWTREVRYAARTLARTPGFTASALATLGLGIGATAAIFSLAYGLWLKPLPYAQPERLVSIRDSYNGLGATVSAPEIAAYAAAPSLASLSAYFYSAVITNGNEPARLVAYQVTPELFSALGVLPRLGRPFTSSDATPGGRRSVIIGDRLWRSRFNADPNIVGHVLQLRDEEVTIVGVMPRGFEFPLFLPSDLWLAFDLGRMGEDRNSRMISTVARLRGGASIDRLRSELSVIASGLAAEYPATNRGWTAAPSSVVDEMVGAFSSAFQFLLGSVAVLLCIASANTASLLIARHITREHEMAIRTALGASSWRVRRLMLTETGLFALMAGMIGVLVALGMSSALAAMLPSGTPRLANLEAGWPIVACALVVSLVVASLCGLSIGNRNARTSMIIRDGRRATAGSAKQRARSGLVIAEVALSLVLLVAAGLMGRGFVRLLRTDRGYNPDRLLTFHLSVPFDRYTANDVRAAAFDRLLERIGALPGITGASSVTGYPGSTMGVLGAGPLESRDPGARPSVTAILRATSPSYFRTMQTPILSGRAFTASDRSGAAGVAIVSQSLARAYWKGESPIGKPLKLPPGMLSVGDDPAPMIVVGVVADMHNGPKPFPELYVPTSQHSAFWADIVVRTAGNPEDAIASVKRAVRDVDAQFLVEQMESMTSIIGDRLALERTQSVLAALFGGLATLLSAVGLYGLLAHLVSQRVQEIGVRRAMGAQSGDILRLVVSRGLRLAAIGVIGGSAGSLALQRVLGSRVFGLGTFDPRVLFAAAAGLVALAAFACYLPARRAIRIDPMTAMR